MPNRKRILSTALLVGLAIGPIILYAYEYGPDPGYAGAPGDNASGCIASGCHTGTVNSGGGSVKITASGGASYLPGQPQQITVTITDSTERRYGFELTARVDSNPRTTSAGTLKSADTRTDVIVCNSAGYNPFAGSCPSGNTLQWITHNQNGYNASNSTPGSYTYKVTWIPPATNVGTVTLYAAGAAVSGALVPTGTNTYLASLKLSPNAASSAPSSITLTTSANPAVLSRSVVLTANVSPSTATGRVTFYDGTTMLGTPMLTNGQAALTTNALASGTRSLRAYYSGDPNYSPSSSGVTSENITALPANGFQSPVTYGASVFTAIATGDFNGDGKADFAAANTSSGLSVYLGNGDGTFRPPVNYPNALGSSLAVGDFNNDGKADILLGGQLLLGNGDGTFQNTNIAGLNPVVAGDFNGDGNLDFAYAVNVSPTHFNNPSATVFVALGFGDGTFQPGINISSLPTQNVSTMVVGDFNGDGIPDLLLSGLYLLLGDGDGTFTQGVSSVGNSAVIGDINGDGKADIAATSGNFVYVSLGNGDGTFQAAMLNFVPGGANSVALGDFNGDGKVDIAVAGGVGIVLLLGNGDGDFQTAVGYGVGNYQSLVVADFNGDGRTDVALASSGVNQGVGVNLYLGQFVPAALTTTRLTTSVNPAVFGQAITLTAAVVPSTATGNVTFYDGSTILGTSVLSSGQAALTTALLASGTHTLKAYYGGSSLYLASAGVASPQSVITTPSVTYQAAATSSAGTNPESIAVGDFDRDGKTDLVIANKDGNVSVLSGNGNGTFKTATNYLAGGHPISVAVGDFNEDGFPDLAVANADSGTVSVLVNLGDGSFRSAVNYPVGANPRSVVVGDFNGDGKPDLAVANNGSNTISVLLGNGDGIFQPAVNYGAGANPTWVGLGDFNADGTTDLAVVNNHDGNVSILLGNGDGTLRPAANYAVGGNPFVATIGDFNGDGKPDLAVANFATNNVSMLLSNGDGTFQPAVNYNAGASPYAIAVGDINGDGKSDLVVTNNTGTTVSVLYGNGNGTVQQPLNYFSGANPNSIAVGDFNGDGRTDLAVTNFSGNNVSILLGSSATVIQLKYALLQSGLVGATIPVVVQVQDSNGKLLSSSAPVTLTSSPSAINSTVNAVNGIATFNVLFNSSNLFMLTATSPGLTSATATLNISNASPLVAIDAPAAGAVLNGGTIAVTGWAVDGFANVYGTAIASVQVKLDGTVVGNAAYGLSRPDVCNIFVLVASCPNVGYTFLLSTTGISNGPHTLTVSATDSDAVPDTGSKSVTFTLSNVPPSVHLDAPLAGSVVSGAATVSGWAIDNASAVGTAISSVQIQVDGTAVGNATYGVARADVCTAYPGRVGCPNVGFTFSLNTLALTPGSHTITAVATDSDGAPDKTSTSVTVTVMSVPPSVYIDSPLPGTVLSGTATITGWALDNAVAIGTPISSVVMKLDGNVIGNATYGAARTDVCTAYPGRPGCPNVGFTYALDTTRFAPGPHTLSAVATDTDGTPDSGSWTVAIQVTAAPKVFIDTPAVGATIGGTVTVSGWAIDNATAIGSVQIKVDGALVGNASYGLARPDVCAAFPGRPGCPNVGFTYQLNTSNLSAGTHTITAVATDTDGTPDMGSYTVTVTVATSAPPLVYVDSLAPGTAVSGTVTLSGWAIDNATAIGSVQIKVDGAVVGNASYSLARPDVCAAFPGRPGCPNVGFTYQLNTSSLSVGPHTITAVATDTDGTPDMGSYTVTVIVATSTPPLV